MMPELPHAPSRAAAAPACQTSEALACAGSTSTASETLRMVLCRLVPVSESGTGNTFSMSIAAFVRPSASAARRNHRRTTAPSITSAAGIPTQVTWRICRSSACRKSPARSHNSNVGGRVAPCGAGRILLSGRAGACQPDDRPHYEPPMERSRGCRLRCVRQGAGFWQQRVALAPPHPAPLEPEYSAPARHGGADAQAAERVHLVHQGGQGHPLTARGVRQLLRSDDAERSRLPP